MIYRTGFVTFLLSRVDRVLLSRLLTLTAFIYYDIAQQVNTATRMTTGSIFTAVLPRLSALD